jgi:tight adherence protein B
LTTLLPALLVFIAIALVTVASAVGWEMLRQAQQRRRAVQQLKDLDKDVFAEQTEKEGQLFRRARRGQLTWLEQRAMEVPRLKELSVLMEHGDVNLSVQTFIYLTFGLAIAGGVTGLLLSGSLIFGLVGAVLLAPSPYMYVKFKKWRRMSKFERQFPEAIDLMGRAIRAGHPLSSGIRMVAEEVPDPMGTEFRRVFEEQRFGLPFADALLSLADRNDLVDVRIFVTAVLIQREVGGNLAEILDKIANMIRMRFAVRRQLRTYTAQGRMSGYVLAAIPFFVGFVIYFLNPVYMKTLFQEPAGRYMILGAGILQLIGFLWIRKIVNIDI